ncbi:ATP-grasp domain-containing protein [Clostridium sp.]|uniref:ATP-grasp domain-containing protein n=1 Tax=Clostridium sp. TaxID=1506 RepID=UPI001A4E51B1|nr:ATP-grasp domain-containing protein [Clostridium sp.]MBK5234484.1 ATP-grasp domain-containing protein [Clostridium sp.]
MKLLILGGGNCQFNAILRAKQMGHTVIVSDYYEDAPGKKFCDYSEIASTFSIDDNISVAKKYDIDGIITLGTDQPVYTVAKVTKECNLPSFLNLDAAKAVTNKKIMKNIFKLNSIPTVKFAFLKSDFRDCELEHMCFPVVIKPLDSQGQRGVYKLNSIVKIREYFEDVISYSREEEALVEEYYENDEITVSGWVENDNTHVLTITDRVTYDNYPSIGICTAHDFPSKHFKNYAKEIIEITKNIVKCFKIHNGPIYFQMLIGKEGIKVNEIACRIGGAYEDEFIPHLTGIDILDMVIDYSLGENIDYTRLREYEVLNNNKKLSVQLLFAKPGTIKSIGDLGIVTNLPGVINAKINFKPGDNIKEITNATQRVGYMIIEGNNLKDLHLNIDNAFDKIAIYDKNNINMIIKF